MGNPKKLLIGMLVFAGVLAVVLVFLLFSPVEVKKEEQDVFYLLEHDMMDVAHVSVNNEEGFYEVIQEGGGFTVHDIPAELVNTDYLQLLLDECSMIAVSEKVSDQPEDLSQYGLEAPRASVEIEYTDGSAAQLLIGQEEKLSDGVYVQMAGDPAVYLMPRSYTIRFTMAVEKFIQYQITPTRKMPSALSVVRDVTFGGSLLPEPIVIEWVDEHDKQEMREAASFGVATHLIRSPGFHELDQTKGAEVFQSMLGIVSEGIAAYNCDENTLSSYGFDHPYLTADFTIQNGEDAKSEEYHLKVVKQDDGSLIMTCNDNAVIYKILDVAFTKITYEDFVMRWFLTPFITDLDKMKVTTPAETLEFAFFGETNKDLSVTLYGRNLNMELFRSYFRLITSACNDGEPRTKMIADGSPVLTVEYVYKDKEKPKDTMKIYEADSRKVLVEVNGKLEFTMKSSYLERVLDGREGIKNGTAIEENW